MWFGRVPTSRTGNPGRVNTWEQPLSGSSWDPLERACGSRGRWHPGLPVGCKQVSLLLLNFLELTEEFLFQERNGRWGRELGHCCVQKPDGELFLWKEAELMGERQARPPCVFPAGTGLGLLVLVFAFLLPSLELRPAEGVFPGKRSWKFAEDGRGGHGGGGGSFRAP